MLLNLFIKRFEAEGFSCTYRETEFFEEVKMVCPLFSSKFVLTFNKENGKFSIFQEGNYQICLTT